MQKIEIFSLDREERGASRYGTCTMCGIGTDKDDTLARIYFNGSSICLCKKHMRELKEKLAEFISC